MQRNDFLSISYSVLWTWNVLYRIFKAVIILFGKFWSSVYISVYKQSFYNLEKNCVFFFGHKQHLNQVISLNNTCIRVGYENSKRSKKEEEKKSKSKVKKKTYLPYFGDVGGTCWICCMQWTCRLLWVTEIFYKFVSITYIYTQTHTHTHIRIHS